MLWNNVWKQKNVIELLDVGLDGDEYEKLEHEEKV
jgi:hypothetical protein